MPSPPRTDGRESIGFEVAGNAARDISIASGSDSRLICVILDARCVGISSGTVDEFDSAVLATLVPAVKALASQRVAAQQRRYPTSDEKISGSRARLLDRAGIA